MTFDPVTLLTIVVVLLLLPAGVLMIQMSRGEDACPALRWSGAAFLVAGLGLGLVLAEPTDISAPARLFGNAALLLAYGLLWKAARIVDRRTAPFEPVVSGALLWLVAVSLFDPSQAWRVGLSSAIVAAYSAAIAWDHHRGEAPSSGRLPSQARASRIFATHGAVFALGTVLQPAFGFMPGGSGIAQFWGALLGVETVVMAVLAGIVAVAMSRERAARLDRREVLEDGLTGIGNRRALLRSGTALLGACRQAGRPAALLLMDLDGFKALNDGYGHPVGDRLLVAFARLAHDYLPPTSLVCRVGGEAFAAVLPGADPGRARAMAEEIRTLFAHLALDDPRGPVRTTVSVGIAQAAASAPPAEEMTDLLGRADRCLSAAKSGGRDRVVAEGDPVPGNRPPAPDRRRTAA